MTSSVENPAAQQCSASRHSTPGEPVRARTHRPGVLWPCLEPCPCATRTGRSPRRSLLGWRDSARSGGRAAWTVCRARRGRTFLNACVAAASDPVPETFVGSGARSIPKESRRVQTWGGYLCGDAHAVVAVNVTPLDARSLVESVRARTALFRDTVSARPIVVAGIAAGGTAGWPDAWRQPSRTADACNRRRGSRQRARHAERSIVAEGRSRSRGRAHPRVIRDRRVMTGDFHDVVRRRDPAAE